MAEDNSQTEATIEKQETSPQKPKTSKRRFILGIISSIIVFICILTILYLQYFEKHRNNSQNNNQSSQSAQEKDSTSTSANIVDINTPVKLISSPNSYGGYTVEQSEYSPQVPDFTISTDNSNVVNYKRLTFSDAIKQNIATDYFAVVEPQSEKDSVFYDEFFDTYTQNLRDDLPSFITTDAVLHYFHLYFDDTLQVLEQGVFFEKVKNVSLYLFNQSKDQYTLFSQQQNSVMSDAARRNVAYFAIALKLLGEKPEVPSYAQDIVTQEWTLISEHRGNFCSSVMNIGDCQRTSRYEEDFTQYIPRGHYTKTEQLQNYFKAMMWYGRVNFRQKVDSENISALLMTYALSQSESSKKDWADVFDTVGFLIGNADDLGIYEYSQTIENNKNGQVTLETVFAEENRSKIIEALKLLRDPLINSMPTFDTSEDVEKNVKGFRLMGQRFTFDANIFQQLMYANVDENPQGEKRLLPKSLDILAIMGSTKAKDLLEQAGDFTYERYPARFDNLKNSISLLTEKDWTGNIYSGWLYSIKPFALPVDAGYPQFMQNDNWQYKDLNSYQGSWTELKHDTVLYAKQPSGAGAAGPEHIDLDDRGYVEPRVEVFARLEALCKSLLEGLKEKGVLQNLSYTYKSNNCNTSSANCYEYKYEYTGEKIEKRFSDMQTMVSKLKTISIKELNNEKLSDDEHKYIKYLGGDFESIWCEVTHSDSFIKEARRNNPVMLITDVATDPNGYVLEEGTGRVMEIYVVIPDSREHPNYYRIARGAVWSQYEFKQPMSERLTDQTWQEKVRNDNLPQLEAWKENYIIKKTNVSVKESPVIYENDVKYGNTTVEKVRKSCTDSGGIFEEEMNGCLEYEPNCGKVYHDVCRYY